MTINPSSFINDVISSKKMLGVENTKAIFLEGIRAFREGEIDEVCLTGVAYELKDLYNEFENINRTDHELGALLHDTDELKDLDEEKKEALKNRLNDYLKTSVAV